MSLFKMFKTDETLETEGVFIEYGQTSKGLPIRIKIARAGGSNIKFMKALEKATKPYRKALQTGTMDNSTADKIYKEVFAETVVLGWENVERENGEVIEFNRDNAITLFNELPELFSDLKEQASNVALFREESLKADLGNSGRSYSTDLSKDQ